MNKDRKERKSKVNIKKYTNKTSKKSIGNIVLNAKERAELYVQVKLVRELLDCIFAQE